MHKPIISVVMCVYNGEKYISKSIESVLNQTITNYELIIVNDGSTDSTRNIVEKYHVNSNVKLINNDKNYGVNYSRNKAIDLSSGKYIAILDADDLMMPNRLKIQSNYLDKNSDVALVGSNATIINDKGKLIRKSNLGFIEHDDVVQRLRNKNSFFAHSSWMFRKSVFEELSGYDNFYTKAEDYDFILRCSELYKVVCLSDCLISLRKTNSSFSYDYEFIQLKLATVSLITHLLRTGSLKISKKLSKDQILNSVEEWFSDLKLKGKLSATHNLTFARYDLSSGRFISCGLKVMKALYFDPLVLINFKKTRKNISNPIESLMPYLNR